MKTLSFAENKKILWGICLITLLLAGLRLNAILHLPETTYFVISRFYFWLVLLIMLLYAYKIEGQKFLLYKEQRYSLWKAVGIGFLMFIIALALCFIVKVLFSKLGFTIESVADGYLTDLFKTSILYYFLTVITAGVTEELLIRGYLQARIEKIFKSSFAGIICSSVLFGLLHLGYGTFYYVVMTFCLGLVFAFFYYKFKNIKILIIFHVIWDCIGLLKYFQ